MAKSKKYKPQIKVAKPYEEVLEIRKKKRQRRKIRKARFVEKKAAKILSPKKEKIKQPKEPKIKLVKSKEITTLESDFKMEGGDVLVYEFEFDLKKQIREAIEGANKNGNTIEASALESEEITGIKTNELVKNYEKYVKNYYEIFGELPPKTNLKFKTIEGIEKLNKYFESNSTKKEIRQKNTAYKQNFIKSLNEFGLQEFIPTITRMKATDFKKFAEDLDKDYIKAIFDYKDTATVSKEEENRIRRHIIKRLNEYEAGKYAKQKYKDEYLTIYAEDSKPYLEGPLKELADYI